MSAVTVELSWSDGVTRTVQVEPVGDWFGVHDDTFRWDGEKHWQLVHLPAGAPLPRRFYTRAGAIAYAAEVAAVADWSSPDRAVLSQRAKEARLALLRAAEKANRADLSAWCDQPLPAWPHDKPPAADHLARYHTVQAALLGHRVNDLVDDGALDKNTPPDKLHAYFDTTLAFLSTWTAAYLLRALQQHAPDAAAEVASGLWGAIESGETPVECSYDWLVGYRIDPAKVTARHAEGKARRAAQQHETGGEAAPSDA